MFIRLNTTASAAAQNIKCINSETKIQNKTMKNNNAVSTTTIKAKKYAATRLGDQKLKKTARDTIKE